MYIVYLILLFFAFCGLFCKSSKKVDWFFCTIWFVLFVTLGTFAYFTEDYDTYDEIVNRVYMNPLAYGHLEPSWVWLVNMVKGDLDEFRLLAFCLISILLLLLAKIVKVDLKYMIIYYTIICLSAHLCWVRQPFAMCLCLLGALLLYNRRYIVGLACLVSSCFLHKSAIMYALIFPMCILPLNKKMLWLYVISIPIFEVFFYVLINSSAELSYLISFQAYAQKGGEFAHRHIIFRILFVVITIGQMILLTYLIVKFRNNSNGLIRLLVRYLMGILFISVVLFLLPIDVGVVYKRLLAFGLFVSVIILSKCVQGDLLKRSYMFLFILILLFSIVNEVAFLGNNYTRVESLMRF